VLAAYIRPMPRNPVELPTAVARRFVEDMRAYFFAPDILMVSVCFQPR